MTEDIRLDVSWLNHRKRKKLEKLLGSQGIVSFIDLMLNTRLNKPDGKLLGMTEEDIALDASWPGNPNQFVKVLCEECKLLNKRDGYYELHNWEKRNPYSFHAKERSEKARKAALVRWGKDKDMLTDANSILDAQSSNAPSPSPSPLPKDPKKEHFKLPTKEEVNESSMPKVKEDLNKICEHLYETKKFLNVHAFKNKMLKEGKYERAILHTLIRCSLKDNFEDSAWGYCIKIIEVENGNYNEYEYRKDKG